MLYGIVAVIAERTGRVDTRTVATTGAFCHTVVVGITTCLGVGLDATIGIVEVHGVDRRNLVYVRETVVHIRALTSSIHGAVSVRQVERTFEPLLSLVVDVGTYGESVEVGVDVVTLILQVTERGVVGSLLRTTGNTYGSIELLTHAEDSVFPRSLVLHTGFVLHVLEELASVAVNECTARGIPEVVQGRQTFGTEELIASLSDTHILHICGVSAHQAVVHTQP